MSDPFDLECFVAAQAEIYTRVVVELSAGRKRSHWMWFIFPQIEGLGSSAMAQVRLAGPQSTVPPSGQGAGRKAGPCRATGYAWPDNNNKAIAQVVPTFQRMIL
jgi:uncharacterized protein DUF1810